MNLEGVFRIGSMRSSFCKDQSSRAGGSHREQLAQPGLGLTDLLARQEASLVCRRLFSILRSQIQVVSLGGGNRDGDQYTQAKEWCFSLLFKNSASLPFAKAEAVLLLRLEFIKASNMINNLYTWIVIQKKKKKGIKAKDLTTPTFTIPAT